MDTAAKQQGFCPGVIDQDPEESTVGALAAVLRQSAGGRHLESGGKGADLKGTNYGFFLGFLGFDATAVIMA